MLSASSNVRLNVGLTFNVKPESETFHDDLPPIQNSQQYKYQSSVDTYAEWDTWETINAVKDAIEEIHDVTLIEATAEAYYKFKEIKPDIVFNIAEGLNGINRESQIPAMLDMLEIPYTGSDALTLGICLDKSRTKEILTYHKIPNAKFIMVENTEDIEKIKMEFPAIVKPVSEGSSKGIFSSSFVNNSNELKDEVNRIIRNYDQPALVEEFLPGREFTIAVMGNDEETILHPIIEIKYDDFPENVIPLYSFEAKWILDTKENKFDVFECPANLDKNLEDKIRSTALTAYKILRCRDWSRIDLRLDKHAIPNIIEINPLPGIMPDPNENSSYPKAVRAAGLTYKQMIQSVLNSALKRYKLI
ncbi:MAG: ATP-grasp domain-containing protein [Ignavibacteriaceae bacterium]|nr:ATP-grasp domain-containing protein [Ignavibacteria bacterium]NNL20893.1 ATP-grasp domain-containing protein [Ignavibacteriaceae bacterium]